MDDQLPPMPWGEDFEAWIESRDATEIEQAIRDYSRMHAAEAVRIERERCAKAFLYWIGESGKNRYDDECLKAIRNPQEKTDA